MLEQTLEIIGTTLSNIALAGAVGFILSYALFFRWWATEAGRSIMGFVTSIVLLTFLAFAARGISDTIWYDWLRLGVFLLVATASWGLLISLWRTWLKSLPDGLAPTKRLSQPSLDGRRSMPNNDKILGTIRTGVPALVGYLIAKLVATVPAVADWLTAFDHMMVESGFVGTTAVGLLEGVAVALTIALYYWLVRTLSPRWPWLETLLGSKKTPVFFKQTEEVKIIDAVPEPENREVVETSGSSVIIAEQKDS